MNLKGYDLIKELRSQDRTEDSDDLMIQAADDLEFWIKMAKSLKSENSKLVTALDCLLRLAERSGLCPPGEKRCEMDMAREALKGAGMPD